MFLFKSDSKKTFSDPSLTTKEKENKVEKQNIDNLSKSATTETETKMNDKVLLKEQLNDKVIVDDNTFIINETDLNTITNNEINTDRFTIENNEVDINNKKEEKEKDKLIKEDFFYELSESENASNFLPSFTFNIDDNNKNIELDKENNISNLNKVDDVEEENVKKQKLKDKYIKKCHEMNMLMFKNIELEKKFKKLQKMSVKEFSDIKKSIDKNILDFRENNSLKEPLDKELQKKNKEIEELKTYNINLIIKHQSFLLVSAILLPIFTTSLFINIFG